MSSAGTEKRLVSLDVFRGATIAAMMLVNNPGDWGAIYAPLEHAPWHGWTFTDLVFPFFLWIVGVAIPLSTARRLEAGADRSALMWHAARRALVIFALGFFLNSFSYLIDGSIFHEGISPWLHNYLTTVRIPGVLQRIAVCYLAAICIYLFANLRWQLIILAALLIGYWVLMTCVPVPGYGSGVLEKQGNLSQYLDNALFNGPVIGTHVYKYTRTWDPEGFLSTLPAIASCLFGVLTGSFLRTSQSRESKAAWIFTAGALLLFLGEIMNKFFPINKNIWTSSYAVFMAGMALICFGCSYWLVDVQGYQRWTRPFAIYGMNAIAVFVLSGLLGRISLTVKVDGTALKTWLFKGTYGQMIADPKLASLAWALSYVLLLYGVAWVMHRKKWYLKA